MKKTIIILGLLLIAFTPPEKKYKFEFNDAQLSALWNCIDNSSAPHDQVKAVEAMIQAQLKSQLPQSPTDSSKLKK